MKAGIAVDDWKLPVFRRRLSAAGYTYVDGGAIVSGVTILHVVTADLIKLASVVADCNAECARAIQDAKGKRRS